MKELSSTHTQGFYVDKINPLWYLAIGIVTMALTHMTFSIEVMAWVSSVPFLIYLSLTQGWKSRLTFFLALVLAWSLVVTKIISDPIPLVLVFLYSIPISLFHLPGYLIWSNFTKSFSVKMKLRHELYLLLPTGFFHYFIQFIFFLCSDYKLFPIL